MKATTSGEKIEQLERRVAELERVVAILGKERDARQPFGPIPAQPSIAPQYPFIPVQPITRSQIKCGKCGINLTDVMSYCCPHADCPCGLGGFSCTD
ncbi:hypothetical protein QF001_000917 [Paraburkholderia youngii]|uniref:hypothetical protein n=1 Tax=Paraburkholderia youngii TaxID=2782701 RepID=UPI003D19C950